MIETKFIETSKGKISYYEQGEGKPIIMLCGHSVPFPLADYYELFMEFSKTNRCIVIDLFGYGNSDILACKHSFVKSLKILEEVISLLTQDKVTLIGHSLGSFYSLCYSAENPQRIEQVVLLDNYPKINNFHLFFIKAMGLCLIPHRKQAIKKQNSKLIMKLLFHNRELPEEIVKQTYKITSERLNNKTVRQELKGAVKTTRRNIRSKKACDIAILSICRRLSYYANKRIEKYFTNIKTVNLGKTSHYVHHDKTEEVISLIKNFLKP